MGFWYRFYQGSKGRIQFGLQYSYLSKDAWSGNGGVASGQSRHLSQGHRQHDIHLLPLLPAVV